MMMEQRIGSGSGLALIALTAALLAALTCLALTPGQASAETKSVSGNYAVLEGTTLTFKYSASETSVTADAVYTGYDTATYDENNQRPWGSSIVKVFFDDSVKGHLRPVSTALWFSGMNKLESIEGLGNLDTSLVTDMRSMFFQCSKLTTLDVSSFDTSHVKNMRYMFGTCSSLTVLDVSGFDTSSVTSMYSMFLYCASLSSLDVSGFDTSSVTDMVYMFANCSKLSSLDVSRWNTSSVASMQDMFGGCSSLSSLDVSRWDTSSVTNMGNMFADCSSLSSLDVSGWDTSSATYMGTMFYGCSSLFQVRLGKKFSFKGGGITSAGSQAILPDSDSGWSLSSGNMTLSAEKLRDSYDGATMAGLWIRGGHKVTVANDGHGTASADYGMAVVGMKVTLAAKPASGYAFDRWQVISGGVTVSGNSFTMGGADVTVKAVFKPSGSSSKSSSSSSTKSSSSGSSTRSSSSSSTSKSSSVAPVQPKQAMHRLYNPNSGEHFYTSDDAERDNLVSVGWNSEGEGWTAPATSNTPVYRMYNPVAGEHHYCMDASEKDMLVDAGWNYEGIGWYSDDEQRVPLYRDYNPNEFANNHNYTVDRSEHDNLVSLGWQWEGYAWYGV